MQKKTILVSAKSLKSTLLTVLDMATTKRVVIRHQQKVLLDLPVGIVGVAAILAPILAGLSAAFIFVRQYEIDVYQTKE